MIIPKKCHQGNSIWSGMSQKWQQDLRDRCSQDEQCRSSKRQAPTAPATWPSSTWARTGLSWWESGSGATSGKLCHSAIPPSPLSHAHTHRHLHQGARPRRRKPVGWKATSCSANALKTKNYFFQSPKTHTNTLGPPITTKAMCRWDSLIHSHSPFSDKASPSWASIIFTSSVLKILGTGPPNSFPQWLPSRIPPSFIKNEQMHLRNYHNKQESLLSHGPGTVVSTWHYNFIVTIRINTITPIL